MKHLSKITTLLFLSLVIFSCKDNDFDNKFDKLPDERVRATLKDYKEALTDAPYGWQMSYSMGANVEYMSYQIVYFSEDNTVKFHSPDLKTPITSEYKLMAEGDIELVFNTFNENLTIFSYPNPKAPNGYGGDIEFNFRSINDAKNEIILEGKDYKGKLILKKAKEEYKDFAKIQEFINYLAQERTARYMNVAITAGLEDASEQSPVSIGLDLSSIARVGDYAFNYKGQFSQGRKMLYFTHTEMGLSTPIKINGHEIQFFTYNTAKKRYEIAGSDLQGYIYCTDLPVYYVPGVVDEFKDNYALWMKASFGKPSQKYKAMRQAIPKIKGMVIVTDYNQRIPLFDKYGNPVLDDSYNHDYELGDKLGDGLLFSFEEVDQFYFYFIPLEIEKLKEDRVRFKRKEGYICVPKKGEKAEPIIESIKGNPKFDDLVSYICNQEGWYIKRTIESGQIDWDFISQANPKEDYFYTRLK
ncbi:DUF4302 domain-containing protein [Weeksellaceae bacterium TAE3-ERU29]|nr:DUF4302 domain-containing protein [Weeksellaceae bacterium TAE3-ERU29]